MRIVKLGTRYILAQYGFTHAVRFERQCPASDAIKKALKQIHVDIDPWNQWWRWQNPQAPWGTYKNSRDPGSPYWIGVKNPVDLTAAILISEINHV